MAKSIEVQKPERPNATKQIALLAAEVESATAGLLDARAKTKKAESDECAAMVRVSKAQRELDAAIDQLRKSAPFDSNWSRANS